MSLKKLLEEKKRIKEEMQPAVNVVEEYNTRLAAIEAEIESAIAGKVSEARKLSGKTTGTVDVLIDGVKVKHCLSKRVVWDQLKLAEIRTRILAGGDDPEKYMNAKTTYSVTEKSYGTFPEPVKAVFSPAREVKAGKPKITFDEA